jgi:ribonuclease M5
MEKLFIKQAIIVEGKYDKIKLSALVDATIITADGFRIFKDKEKCAMIRAIAKKDGIIVLTDSDVAGFRLRSYLKSVVQDGNIINIYIPQIEGKEKRKANPSKEGLLGVEGIDNNTLRKLFEEAGVFEQQPKAQNQVITKMHFYQDGLIGMQDSKQKRIALLKHLGLPHYLTTNSLLEIINRLMTLEEYQKYIQSVKSN